jgi:hypothetical protein
VQLMRLKRSVGGSLMKAEPVLTGHDVG